MLYKRVSLSAFWICETKELNGQIKKKRKERRSWLPFKLCQVFLKSPMLMCELAFLTMTHIALPQKQMRH